MKLFVQILLFVFLWHGVYSQGEYFEGSMTFSHQEFDSNGKKMATPVDKEIFFYKKNILLTKVISGPQLRLFGDQQIYMDSEKKIRYVIHKDKGYIQDLGIPSVGDKIDAIEEKTIGEEEILGYKCDIQFLKYVHKFEGPGGSVNDTLSCTYYVSKNLRVFHPEKLALLQGNINTKILDGRFKGIPLKIIIKRQNKSMLVIECVDLKIQNVDEVIKLPDLPFKNK